MSGNKATVERYLDGFKKTDRAQILSTLTDDVEWEIPGFFHVRGKEEFEKHIVDDGFTGSPTITMTRLIESHDVVVVEGTVRAPRTDGTVTNLVFCDIFELSGGRIKRLVSYLMEVK